MIHCSRTGSDVSDEFVYLLFILISKVLACEIAIFDNSDSSNNDNGICHNFQQTVRIQTQPKKPM